MGGDRNSDSTAGLPAIWFALNTLIWSGLWAGVFLAVGALRAVTYSQWAPGFLLTGVLDVVLFYGGTVAAFVAYNRVLLSFWRERTGVFRLSEALPFLRVTTDALVSSLTRPVLPFFPPLLPLMGAKVGTNSPVAGKVFNPEMLEIGDNVIVGAEALLTGHTGHSDGVVFGRIRIASGATVGIRSVILPDVEIGEGAVVAAQALVPMGTRIPPYEVWGGIPARKIGDVRKAGN
jgi:serine acetyltransferase